MLSLILFLINCTTRVRSVKKGKLTFPSCGPIVQCGISQLKGTSRASVSEAVNANNMNVSLLPNLN